jgi:hypothetical protein
MLDFFAVLTDLQCSRVKHLQIFAHMGWLEGDFRSSRIWRCLDREPLNLDTFTITIRHSDWWHWETDEPLWLPTCWPRTMLQSPRANRIDELLVVDPLDETTWSGPVDLGGQQHAIYAHCEKLDYRVITMKWRRRRRVAAETEQRWREEGSLLTLCEPARIRTEEEENDDEEFFY